MVRLAFLHSLSLPTLMVFSSSPSTEEADLGGGGMLRRFKGSPAAVLLPAEAVSGTEDAVQLLDILLAVDEDDFGASLAAAATVAFNGSKSSSKTRDERTSLQNWGYD